jgi:hypothetical protein
MTTVARAARLGRARRIGAPLALAAVVGVAGLALQLRDPHRHGSWGLCPFKALTGWDCPLCGGLRAVNDLGDGRLLDAAHSNLLLVASLPLVVALWALWVRAGWTGTSSLRVPPGVVRPLLVAAAVLAVVFTVYRNTPWGVAWHAA